MLDAITMGRKIADKEYKKLEAETQYALFQAHRKIIERKIPLLIQIAGVTGAGRGSVINMLNQWMDNKFIRTYTAGDSNDVQKAHPDEWRFWVRLPAEGETVVFYDSMYSLPVRERVCGKISQSEYEQKVFQYYELEQMLADSGMAIVKIWLHLDKKNFNHISKKREKNKELRPYTPYDRSLAKRYETHIKRVEEVIEHTDTANAPWTLIDAADENYRNIAVAKAIIEAVDNAVETQTVRQKRQAVAAKSKKTKPQTRGILSKVDLTQSTSKDNYVKELEKLQNKIRMLSYEAYKRGIATNIVFEGWDAAGKGSTIRRLVAALDARIASVTPIAAPTPKEKAHHYLWRFWQHIPEKGHVSIFDRSWYGRVMVERVEKFTPVEDWSRAYSEINAFERRLTKAGQIVLKFWLHISPDEQLKRFKERQSIPRKQHKITDEDWRNRAKWKDYEVAVEEMLQRTNTKEAPWYVVPANDKQFARLFVLRTFVAALKKALKE